MATCARRFIQCRCWQRGFRRRRLTGENIMHQLCDATRSTLILVDLQERLMPAIHDGHQVAERAMLLAETARLIAVPVIATEQSPASLGSSLPGLGECCTEIITKTHFEAFAEAGTLSRLDPQRDELLIAGCEAHVCVLQTVLGLTGRGYRVRLVSDAIGSRHPPDRAAAIDRAMAAGVSLVTTEMVIFEWLRHSEHPAFRQVLQLVKQASHGRASGYP